MDFVTVSGELERALANVSRRLAQGSPDECTGPMVDDDAAAEEAGEYIPENVPAVLNRERWGSFVPRDVKGSRRIMAMLARYQ